MIFIPTCSTEVGEALSWSADPCTYSNPEPLLPRHPFVNSLAFVSLSPGHLSAEFGLCHLSFESNSSFSFHGLASSPSPLLQLSFSIFPYCSLFLQTTNIPQSLMFSFLFHFFPQLGSGKNMGFGIS